jgi:intracellular sulfur oxidation DsrE/DsrF family protein
MTGLSRATLALVFKIRRKDQVHMSTQSPSSPERRSFLTRLNTRLVSLAAMTGVAMAQENTPAPARWAPSRHEKDDWLDQPTVKHRVLFDTTTPEGFGDAVFFANNFVRVNRTDYSVQSNELSVVIVARHRTTPYGYNDAMWAKYGMALAARARVEDPKMKLPPKVNLFNTAGYGELLNNRGTTLDAVTKQGVQLAVCSISTRAYASIAAQTVGGNVDAVFAELTANLVSNARMVPAGIVTVTRAQERGYSLVSS